MILDSYARESRPGDKRNVSITSQHAVNVERINDLGGTLGEQLDDKGRSAWVPDVKRPDWEELIYRGENDLSDGVVVFDIERLLRRVEDAFRIHKLAQGGFLVYDSDMTYDLTTAAGENAFYNAAIAAQYYARRLSDRVKRGQKKKAQRGEGRQGRWRPFCFERVPADEKAGTSSNIRVYEPERPYGEEVARRWLSGEQSWIEICDWLESEGIRTGAGNPWRPVSLRNAMRTPRMAGLVMYDGEVVGRLPGEPVLDTATWMQICQKIEGNRGRPSKQHHQACSGLVYCDDCGRPIGGRKSPHGRTYDDGTEAWEYTSRKDVHPDGSCMKQIADLRALDEVIGALVIRRLLRIAPTLRERAVAMRKAAAPHVEEIKRLEKIRETWVQKLLEPRADMAFYQSMLSEVDEKLSDQREALSALENDVPSIVPGEVTRAALVAKWRGEDLDHVERTKQRRRMIQEATQGVRIYVSPGSVRDSLSEVRDRVYVVPTEDKYKEVPRRAPIPNHRARDRGTRRN